MCIECEKAAARAQTVKQRVSTIHDVGALERELEMLREFESDVRQARRNSLGAENFAAVVSAALDRFDRKRATP